MIEITQEQIMQNWNSKIPLVSISCITYNHEPYIAQALNGFLMQKTSFPFEVLIHDDASTDRTADIIREYEKKFPNLIKPIYQKENQYSKGFTSVSATWNFPRAQGKYIALCEGDDYWIDENKLQMQVDFLENNESYTGCFHGAEVVAEEGLSADLYSNLKDKDYSSTEILRKWIVPTASVMFRREILSLVPWNNDFMHGDIVYFLTITNYGKFRCMKEKMSVYRRTQAGVIGKQSKNRNSVTYDRRDAHYRAIRKEFPKVSWVLITYLRVRNFVGKILFLTKSILK